MMKFAGVSSTTGMGTGDGVSQSQSQSQLAPSYTSGTANVRRGSMAKDLDVDLGEEEQLDAKLEIARRNSVQQEIAIRRASYVPLHVGRGCGADEAGCRCRMIRLMLLSIDHRPRYDSLR